MQTRQRERSEYGFPSRRHNDSRTVYIYIYIYVYTKYTYSVRDLTSSVAQIDSDSLARVNIMPCPARFERLNERDGIKREFFINGLRSPEKTGRLEINRKSSRGISPKNRRRRER